MIDWSHKRYQQLINILINNKGAITSEQLATKLNVSSRTIRNDLNRLDSFFVKENIDLNKKPGLGIWLEIEQGQREKLIDKIYNSKKIEKRYSPTERKKIILKKLLTDNSWITMNRLGKELFVSRSTIFKDIKRVKNWLGEYDLILKKRRNRGIKIAGKEIRIREAIVNLLFEFLDRSEFDQIIYLLISKNRINTREFSILNDFFGDINLHKIKMIVYDWLIKREYQFSDRAILYLVLYLAIVVKRIKSGEEITEISNDIVVSKLKEMNFWEKVIKIKNKFSAEFSIEISNKELIAAAAQFLCLELKRDFFINNLEQILSDFSEEIFNITDKFTKLVKQELNLDFKSEEDLFLDFIFHINYIYSHYKYGVSRKKNFKFSQILLDELNAKNGDTFKLVEQIKKNFPKDIRKEVKKEDLEYIFILLLSLINRNQDKITALVVCSKQNPTYKLLVDKLQNRLNCLEIIDVLSYYEAKHKKIKNVDLIISCSELKDSSNNVIISPVVSNEDIKLILDKIEQLK
ncbi:MAG: HTH domain-containing protein [Halanaerobacter sp.]